MLSLILLFLKGNWRLVAIGAVLFSVVTSIAWYRHEVKVLEEKNLVLSVDLKASLTSVKALTLELDKQSAAVAAIKELSDKKAKEAAQAIAKASAMTIVAKRDAVELMKRTKPADKTACEAATALFDAEVRK